MTRKPTLEPAIKILPSLLAGDFGHLEDAALQAQAAGADALHLDIMDAHFVPNLSMGPDVVRMAKRVLKIPLNVHLMMTRPDMHADMFLEAGASALIIHAESSCDILPVLKSIRSQGRSPGVALNPETPPEAVYPFLEHLDIALCMTVHPGFGGQRFMLETLPKIEAIHHRLQSAGLRGPDRVVDIIVDGGIDLETAPAVAAAGANGLVAGSFLYRSADMAGAAEELRRIGAASLSKALAQASKCRSAP